MKYLFEVSWEVCNLVGGIYTVLRSKTPQAVAGDSVSFCIPGDRVADTVRFLHRELGLEKAPAGSADRGTGERGTS